MRRMRERCQTTALSSETEREKTLIGIQAIPYGVRRVSPRLVTPILSPPTAGCDLETGLGASRRRCI